MFSLKFQWAFMQRKCGFYPDFSPDTKRLLDDLLSKYIVDFFAQLVWGCVLVESSDFPFGNTMCPEEGEGWGGTIGDLAELQHTRAPDMSPLKHRHQRSSWINDHRPDWGHVGEVRTRGQLTVEWTREGLMKDREKFKETQLSETDSWGRGRGPCVRRASSFHWRLGECAD